MFALCFLTFTGSFDGAQCTGRHLVSDIMSVAKFEEDEDDLEMEVVRPPPPAFVGSAEGYAQFDDEESSHRHQSRIIAQTLANQQLSGEAHHEHAPNDMTFHESPGCPLFCKHHRSVVLICSVVAIVIAVAIIYLLSTVTPPVRCR